MDDARLGPPVSRRRFLRSAGLVALAGSGVSLLASCGGSGSDAESTAEDGKPVTLYRQEGCSCCAVYADYLGENGFAVEMNTLDDLAPIRERYGIPDDAVGCHTSVIDDYVVEGHVPVEAIERLVSERPELDGISVTGMPSNSPGMGEPNGEPLEVVAFRNGQVTEYLSISTF